MNIWKKYIETSQLQFGEGYFPFYNSEVENIEAYNFVYERLFEIMTECVHYNKKEEIYMPFFLYEDNTFNIHCSVNFIFAFKEGKEDRHINKTYTLLREGREDLIKLPFQKFREGFEASSEQDSIEVYIRYFLHCILMDVYDCFNEKLVYNNDVDALLFSHLVHGINYQPIEDFSIFCPQIDYLNNFFALIRQRGILYTTRIDYSFLDYPKRIESKQIHSSYERFTQIISSN